MPKKTGREEQIKSILNRIDKLLTQAHEEILTDLERRSSLRKYTYEDLHNVVNDLYKLAITKDMLAKKDSKIYY